MTWPTPQDYREAIQSPHLCFSDPELQHGKPRLDSLGLPKPSSGNFATVYEILSQGKRWAVRCFSREFVDQQKRYELISQHLHKVRLPYTVDFKFQSQGIKVNGRWYPILKMEWVDGTPLITFIEKHITQPLVIRDLACKWSDLVAAMRQSSVAHGDLQHGNIMVANGQIKLIDYDGMFVPGLTGFPSHEIGHPSYQHPLRTQADFDLYLDNFSAWVIYLSLVAVACDPQLWTRMGAGDREERLLFRREDFDAAKPSATLATLKKNGDAQIRALAVSFESLLYMPPSQIPSLDGALVQIRTPVSTTTTLPDWLVPHQSKRPQILEKEMPDSTWLIDHLPRRQPARLDCAYTLDRAVLTIFALSLFILTSGVSAERLALDRGLMIGGGGSVLAVGLFVFRYRTLSVFREKNDLLIEARTISEELLDAEREAQGISKSMDRNLSRKQSQINGLKARQEKLIEKQKVKVDAIETSLRTSLDVLNVTLLRTNKEESDVVQRAESHRLKTTNDLNRKRQDILSEQARELDKALADHKQTYLRDQLLRFAIKEAWLAGIGPALRDRLERAGITTASDVEYANVRRVDGIGNVKAQALVSWRRDLEKKLILQGGLGQLDQATEQEIKNRYGGKLNAITAQETEINRKANDEKQRMAARANSLRQQIYTKRSEEQAQAAKHIESIRAKYSPGIEALTTQIQEIISNAEEERALLSKALLSSRKAVMEKTFSAARMQFEISHYRNISFVNYVKGMFS